jgi:hypothetical protein
LLINQRKEENTSKDSPHIPVNCVERKKPEKNLKFYYVGLQLRTGLEEERI